MKRQGRTPTINRSSNELKGKEKARTLNSRRRLVKGDGMEGFGDSSNAPKKLVKRIPIQRQYVNLVSYFVL